MSKHVFEVLSTTSLCNLYFFQNNVGQVKQLLPCYNQIITHSIRTVCINNFPSVVLGNQFDSPISVHFPFPLACVTVGGSRWCPWAGLCPATGVVRGMAAMHSYNLDGYRILMDIIHQLHFCQRRRSWHTQNFAASKSTHNSSCWHLTFLHTSYLPVAGIQSSYFFATQVGEAVKIFE